MTNHVVTLGIVSTLKAMMRRPELFGRPKPAPPYALNVDDVWRETAYLTGNTVAGGRHGSAYGRAYLFLHYSFDRGVNRD